MTTSFLRGPLLVFLAAAAASCSGTDTTPGAGGDDAGQTTLPDGATPPSNGHDAGGDAAAPPGDDTGDDDTTDAATGDDATTGNDGSTGGDSSTGAKHIKTVFVIVMENHNWDEVNTATYIKSLIPQASICDNYFDNPKAVHPSEPNYIWMEAGDNLGFTDDSSPSASHSFKNTDHLTAQLTAKGVSWKSYQEDLPAGTCGISSTGHYAPKHDPMIFFTDVSGDPPSNSAASCTDHVKPYTQLATDLQANTVAQYNFITPNLCNDMHDSLGCQTIDSVKNGDNWLKTEVPKILASQAYKDNGALFITWDESENGEHPIGMIVLSPLAKGGGYVSHTKYFHSSLLRTVEEIFGVPLLRDAANQPSLSDLFTSYP